MSLRKIQSEMIEESFRQDITKEINSKIDEISSGGIDSDVIIEINDRIEELRAELDANKYIHPESHPASMIVQDVNNRFVTDIEKNTWSNKANNSLATTSANGLMSKEDKVKLDGLVSGGTDGTNDETIEEINSRIDTHAGKIATTTDYGHIKTGQNIYNNNGTISVPNASSSTAGVIMVGDGLKVANGVVSANCYIDSSTPLSTPLNKLFIRRNNNSRSNKPF